MGCGRRTMYAGLISLEEGWDKHVTIKINHCLLLELEKANMHSLVFLLMES